MNTHTVKHNLKLSIVLILSAYIIGLLFYHLVEKWSYIDALYFLTATFTTIGYGDITPKTDTGKIFTIIISWVGISLGFFLLYSMMAYRETTVDGKIVNKLRFFRDFILMKKKRK